MIAMLTELRESRDKLVELLEEHNGLVDRLTQVTMVATACQKREQRIRKEAAEQQHNLITLKETLSNVEEIMENQRQEIANLREDLVQARASTPSSLETSMGNKRSAKLPDPEKCLGLEHGPEFFSWKLAIVDKLTGNADHYPTPASAAIYVMNRTGDKAAEYIASYRRQDHNYFKSTEQVLQVLQDHYQKSDQDANSREAYRSMRQTRVETFRQFYERFRKEAAFLGYSDDRTIADIKEKISTELRNVIATQVLSFKILTEWAKYLEQIDDQIRLNTRRNTASNTYRSQVGQNNIATGLPASRAKATTPVVPVVPAVMTPGAKPPMSPEAMQAMANRNCFHCGEHGHIARDCPRNTKSVPHVADRIHEMEMEEAAESENEEPAT